MFYLNAQKSLPILSQSHIKSKSIAKPFKTTRKLGEFRHKGLLHFFNALCQSQQHKCCSVLCWYFYKTIFIDSSKLSVAINKTGNTYLKKVHEIFYQNRPIIQFSNFNWKAAIISGRLRPPFYRQSFPVA